MNHPTPSGVPVLMYHWIDPKYGKQLKRFGVRPQEFERQMEWLAHSGWRCLSLKSLTEHLSHGTPPPPRSFVLTFDDGYCDLEETVAPVLERHGFSATVFLVTDYVGATNVWASIHGDIPRRLLGWNAIRRLDGKTLRFESHSCKHPFLTDLSSELVRREVEESKHRLEDELGREVTAFSYPHGLFNLRIEEMVREAGYRCAVTDIRGLNDRTADPMRLRRVMMTFDDHRPGFFLKVQTGHDLFSGMRALVGLSTNAPDDIVAPASVRDRRPS